MGERKILTSVSRMLRISWLTLGLFGMSLLADTPEATIYSPAGSITVAANQSVTFEATTSSTLENFSVNSYTWTFGNGASANGEYVTYAYPSSGTYTATLKVSYSYQVCKLWDPDFGCLSYRTMTGTSSATRTITVVPPPKPSITLFSASRTAITAGEGTWLSWNVANAPTSVTINPGVGAVNASGSVQVYPSTSTNYTILASNPQGTDTSQVSVTVYPVPVASNLTASENPVRNGASTYLTPTFSGGTGSISPGIGAVSSGGSYQTGALTVGTDYVLTVTNPLGVPATRTLSVGVLAVSVGVSPSSATKTADSGAMSFSASVSGAANTAVTWKCSYWSTHPVTGQWVQKFSPIGSDGTWTIPFLPADYTITATSVQDPTKFGEAHVTVVLPPAISSFTADANPVLYQGSTTLRPVFSEGSGVIVPEIGAVTSGGAYSTSVLTAGKTYTLTVTNAAGTPTSQPLLVGVQPVSVTPGANFWGGYWTRGVHTAIPVSASVSGATNSNINWSASNGSFSATTSASGIDVIWYPPAVDGAYNLYAKSAADPTQQVIRTYTIVSPATASLVPSTNTPLYGGAVTLTPSFSGTSGSVDQGVGAVSNGVGFSSGPITAPKKFTLTTQNQAGTPATAETTLTPQTVAVKIAPTPSMQTSGAGTVSFAATVTGASTTSVIWKCEYWTTHPISGLPIMKSSPIGSDGSWTVPYLEADYTITATSTADGSKSDHVVVTVVAPPQATSLDASTPAPVRGGTFTLTPNYAGGTGSLNYGIPCPASGVTSPAITANWAGVRTYTLTVTNEAGTSVTKSVDVTPQTVVVGKPIPDGVTKTVSSVTNFTSLVTGGALNTVTWSASAGVMDSVTGVWTAPATPTTVTITATSKDDTSKASSTTVYVVAAPVATSLVGSSVTPVRGGTFTLTPTYSNGTGSIDKGVVCPASGVASAAIVADWAGVRRYTLTVTNAAGTSDTKFVDVTPQTVLVGKPNPDGATKTVSSVTNFTSMVTGGALNTVTWSATAGVIDSATGAWTAPATPTTVTITATSKDDTSKANSTTAYVVAAPIATSLTPASTNVPIGTATTITPVFSNGTGVVDQGVGLVTSGVPFSSGNISVAKTFTLTVTNAAGTPDTKSVVVTPMEVAVSPSTASLSVGGTQGFSASITGGTNNALTWNCTGGNLSSTTGANTTWTAPGTAGTYTITATSQADSRAVASATVTVHPQIGISPPSASIHRGGALSYAATVTGASNHGVRWSASGGTLSATTGGSITWSAPTALGAYTITATSDADALVSGNATANVVNRPPQVPGLGTPSLRVGIYHSSTVAAGSDPDGDVISTSVTGLPSGLTYDAATGLVAGIPTLAGSFTVTVVVSDALGASASTYATWAVQDVGDVTPPPGPSLPPDATYRPTKALFAESLKYGGSDTGLITSVDVTRQLQADVAALATGKDKASHSSYSYGYDPLGQLVRADGAFYTDATKTTSVFVDNTLYTYDKHGNRATHTPNGKGAWTYSYQSGTNQLTGTTGDYSGFSYTEDGAVKEIVKNGNTQTFTYTDPRFMRLPTRMNRVTADGRTIDTTLRYDMSGTRVFKVDKVTQGADLISDRETIYLANGTEVLMEIEKRGITAKAQTPDPNGAPERYTAFIFGAGSRLARLSWDADGRPAAEAGAPLIVQNPGFEQQEATSAPTAWSNPAGSAAVVSDATLGNVVRITRGSGTYAYVEQSLGTFNAGETIRVRVKVRGDASGGGGRVAFAGTALTGSSGSSSAVITGNSWQELTLTNTLPATGNLVLQLLAEGAVDQQAFFDGVQLAKLPPALTTTGKPNLWPDPGFEYLLGVGSQAGSVALTNNTPDTFDFDKVRIEAQGDRAGWTFADQREGLHVLRIDETGSYKRTVSGLAAGTYTFSIWKKADNQNWQRVTQTKIVGSDGLFTLDPLNGPAIYDQAELVAGAAPAESWIPENRLGRVDWFITDHLGSTKLLIDQNGQHRFTGDDDPFGTNLRSFGDKDTHRYTGQILDEEQGVYYYGARYYLPEIGRFLSGDPKEQFNSPYLYVGNNPLSMIDPTGEEGFWSDLGQRIANGVDTWNWKTDAEMSMYRGWRDQGIQNGMNSKTATAYADSMFKSYKGAGITLNDMKEMLTPDVVKILQRDFVAELSDTMARGNTDNPKVAIDLSRERLQNALETAASLTKDVPTIEFGVLSMVGSVRYAFTKEMHAGAEVIARGSGIRKIDELVEKFGGTRKGWVKMKTWTDAGEEIHYYFHKGIGRVGEKLAGSPDPF